MVVWHYFGSVESADRGIQVYLLLTSPLPEQTAIVRFMDWAERRIRRVIRARRQRIKLLEEYKLALIHQAVTGKIDVRTGKPTLPTKTPAWSGWARCRRIGR